VGEVICNKESKKVLDYNEFLELQNAIKLIPALNAEGIETSFSFDSKYSITVFFVNGEQFSWDNNIISQETKDRFYKKVEELLEK
jgi:hypothetical protein